MKASINLRKYVDQINKSYPNCGFKPAVFLGAPKRTFLKSGIPEIDAITGGGYPKGKLSLISGIGNSGKTYIALRAAAAANMRGGYVVWFDNDRTFDMSRALDCGVDPDRFYLVQANDTAESLDIALAFARSGEVELIVFDTLTSLVPKRDTSSDEMDAIFYDTLNNKYYNDLFERFFAIVSALDQTVIATTITYKNPNVLYGNPETIEGGRSLKFYAGLWLDLNHPLIIKKAPLKDCFALHHYSEVFTAAGLFQHVMVKKNKYAPPFMDCHFSIPFDMDNPLSGRDYLRPKTNKNGIAKNCAHYKLSCKCHFFADSFSDFYGLSCKRCPFYADDKHENELIFVNDDCFVGDTIVSW